MILGGAVLGGTPLSAGTVHAPAGGAVNYTLTCDAGAYVLAGQDATLTYIAGAANYTLTCDAGAYALAGQAATLQRGYSLTCQAGAYVLSGQSATLQRGYSLICAPGSYTLAGVDATLTYTPGAGATNYVLICDAGVYALSGGSAALNYVPGTPQSVPSGGWMGPNIRRKTKQDIYRERVRLGIIIEDIEEAAEKIVEEKVAPVIDNEEIVSDNRPDVADLVILLMQELRVTVKSPDYTRAIQAALSAKRMEETRRLQRMRDEEDEEEALMLLM